MLSDSLLHPRMKRRVKDSTGSAEAGISREREEPIRLAVVINKISVKFNLHTLGAVSQSGGQGVDGYGDKKNKKRRES